MNAQIRCQCGTISLSASLPTPLSIYCCHCLECQKQSSSAFGTSAIFPAAGMWPLPLSVLQNLSVYTRPTDAGNTLECYFCKICGVRILHRSIRPDGTAKDVLSVKGGCVEGMKWEGVRHIYTRSARVEVPEGSDLASPVVKPGMEKDEKLESELADELEVPATLS